MRFSDILWLSLSTLYQQRLRTLLTTLSVVFGSFVLVSILSMGSGVQEAIAREYGRFAGLRQIDVGKTYGAPLTADADETIGLIGVMSEEKRQRLRDEILSHQTQEPGKIRGTNLTPDMLRRLPAVPHVKSMVAEVDFYGRALLNHHSEKVFIHSSPPDREQLLRRVVAGRFLRAAEADAVVVTEYLLYRLGLVDDEAVQAVLGQKLRLEYQTGTSAPTAILMLSGLAGIPMSPEKQQLLDKVVKQLPAALDGLDLTPNEKEILRKTLRPPAHAQPSEVRTIAREFTIVGVLRSASKLDLRNGYLDWWLEKVDVVLPVPSALELYFEAAAHREYGLHRVMVEVDSPEHVKEVAQAIEALGLRSTAMMELIERHQFAYLLLFAVMACIAVVALLMAALSIINTMLMSVLERRREIGVMKALGARNSHIQSIFLLEGALLGLTGALLGLLAGWAVSLPGDAWVRALIASRLQIEPEESVFVWPAWLLLGTPLFACLVTTLAAVYPAHRAARVDPITVLRIE